MTDAALLAGAQAAAEASARGAGMTIRILDRIEEHAEVRALIEEVWQTGERNPPVTADMLSAIRVAGGYVSGAFDDEGLAAACLGFFGPPTQRNLHSHIAGALPRTRGTGVGFALKQHQRAWARQQGAQTITWTFDPLIRRNAWFNLGKLAAGVGDYLPDLYGAMDDEINRDDITDRVLARWTLDDPATTAAAAGRPKTLIAQSIAGAAVALRADDRERPVIGDLDAETLLIAVPADIEGMRAQDAARSAAWRLAIRETLGVLIAEGATVRGFDRAGWYIVDRAADGPTRTEKP